MAFLTDAEIDEMIDNIIFDNDNKEIDPSEVRELLKMLYHNALDTALSMKLSTILANDNVTGGNNIVVKDTDFILSEAGDAGMSFKGDIVPDSFITSSDCFTFFKGMFSGAYYQVISNSENKAIINYVQNDSSGSGYNKVAQKWELVGVDIPQYSLEANNQSSTATFSIIPKYCKMEVVEDGTAPSYFTVLASSIEAGTETVNINAHDFLLSGKLNLNGVTLAMEYNSTSVVLSKPVLNALYPDALPGLKVICVDIQVCYEKINGSDWVAYDMYLVS